MDNTNEITQLKAEIERQKQIINDLEIRLKKYTNNPGHKKYLEEHKDKINTIKKNILSKIKNRKSRKTKRILSTCKSKTFRKEIPTIYSRK